MFHHRKINLNHARTVLRESLAFIIGNAKPKAKKQYGVVLLFLDKPPTFKRQFFCDE